MDELEELEEEQPKTWPHKLAFILFACFMILIILVYILPGDVLPILEGKLESSKISENFAVKLKQGNVIFTQEIYEELKQLYLDNQETEIKVCLIGEKRDNDFHITSLELPQTISKTVFSVTSEICSKETLIPLHTHPYKHCLFSEQDIKSYEAFKKINPDAIIGIMCEIDRFSFYP